MTTDAFNEDLGSRVAQTPQNSSLGFLMDLRGIYLKVGDPTEYRFAVRHFPGGWEGWKACCDSQDYIPIIREWREELAAKLASEALQRILYAAEGETRDALSANKYIYEALVGKDKSSVGRPSNDKIQREARKLLEDERIKEEAFNRIFNSQG